MLCLLKPCLAVYLETHFNFPCNLFAHSFPAECILGCITALPSFEKKYEAFGVEEAPVLLRCWASPMVCATQELVLGTAVPSWIIHRGELWWWMIGCKQCMTLCMTLRESKHISFYFHFFFFFFPGVGQGPMCFHGRITSVMEESWSPGHHFQVTSQVLSRHFPTIGGEETAVMIGQAGH